MAALCDVMAAPWHAMAAHCDVTAPHCDAIMGTNKVRFCYKAEGIRRVSCEKQRVLRITRCRKEHIYLHTYLIFQKCELPMIRIVLFFLCVA